MKKFRNYYLFACLAVLIVSTYPLYMGARVVADMITDGTVLKENYPKYIIPYTPISLAVLVGVAVMPLCMKLLGRRALLGGSALAVSGFFALEMLLENKVVVTAEETVSKLEDWQMYMCYQPPGGWETTTYKTQTPVEILMGEYNPAFKLHFYIISLVLILTLLNGIYGFGQMLRSGDRSRRKALVLQSVTSLVFLGLCILACFTAFWRDGKLQVSTLSAWLMSLFFVLMGLTGGIFVGSFLLRKRKPLSIWIPAAVSGLLTALMYVGELIVLHGNLYRFGQGWFFDGLPGIVLAPVDILVILVSCAATVLIFGALNRRD